MGPSALTRVLLGATVVLAVAGAVQAVRLSSTELAAFFAVITVLTLVQWVRLAVGRPQVPLRADLVRWLTERSQLTGEHADRIADRAVAAYRAGVTGDRSGVDGAAGDADDSEQPTGTG